MACAPVRSIIPSLKLGDYLSVQAHNPCSISHRMTDDDYSVAAIFQIYVYVIISFS